METLAKVPLGPAANPPGEILRREFLEPLGLSQNELATKTALPRMQISEIIRGRRRITANSAIALGEGLGTGPQFWMNLQTDYDLALEAKKSARSLGPIILRAKRASLSARAVPATAKAYAAKKTAAPRAKVQRRKGK
jgi:addiction module HigA family antidote